MELRLSSRLALTQEDRLELRQGLTLALLQRISAMQAEVVGPPSDLLANVVGRVISSLEDPNLREALKAVFSDPQFLDRIMMDAPVLMKPTKKAVHECVARHFFDAHQGAFSVVEPEEKEQETHSEQKTSVVKFPYETFSRALSSPDELKMELATLNQEVRSNSGEGLMMRRREIKDALITAEMAKESLDLLERALALLLTTKESGAPEGAEPLLREFLTEYVVLRKLAFTISDRMQKRFASSFNRARRGESGRLEEAFLNTIGEYVLISMGIIDPDIFSLRKQVIEKEEADELRKTFKEVGISYDDLCKKYALKGEGKIFWNRWATLQVPATLDTDDRIRDFITKSVRDERGAILAAARYPEMFEEVLEAKEEHQGRSKEDVMELQDALRAIIAKTLEEEDVKETLKGLIKKRWYPELQTFFRKRK